MKKETLEFLTGLEVYPTSEQINDANNFAQEKALEVLNEYDLEATLIVEGGECYISNTDIYEEFQYNVQATFDESFGTYIYELQEKEELKSKISDTILEAILKDSNEYVEDSGQSLEEYHTIDFEEYPEGWDCVFPNCPSWDELSQTEQRWRDIVFKRALLNY